MIGVVLVFALAGALWLAGTWCAVGFALCAEPAKGDE